MKNKKVIIAVFLLVWYSAIFGFAVPSLISEKSDIATLLGFTLSIVHVVTPILWFNREKKERSNKDSV